MANVSYQIAPEIKADSAWTSENPVLGTTDAGDTFGGIVFATGSTSGTIMVWGTGQTYTAAKAAGQVLNISPFNDGIPLTSGRVTMKEVASGSIISDGWYTIAELGTTVVNLASADFRIADVGTDRGGTTDFHVDFTADTLARTHLNTTLEITGRSYRSIGQIGIKSVRIAKSDSLNNAGAKIQVLIDQSGSYSFTTQLIGNIGRPGESGFQLVTPYLDNTPTLPDGVTVGTFLEAGEEYSINTVSAFMVPSISAYKTSSNNIRVFVIWPEIPKQGTTMTLTLPTTLTVWDGQGNSGTITGAHTTGSPTIDGKNVLFDLAETGAFSTVNVGPLNFRVSGAGFKLKIS